MDPEAPPVYVHHSVIPFQHIDAAGIVFFARVFDYFHDAWVGLLADAGHPLPEVLRDGRWIAPLVHAEADYRRPFRFGQVIAIRIDTVTCTGSKAIVSYRIESDGKTCATGQTVHLFMNTDFDRIPIPDALSARFQQRSAT